MHQTIRRIENIHLGKAIVYSEYDNWGYFYIEGDTIYEENGYTGELELRGRLVPLDTK